MGAARVGKTLGNFRILECLGSGGSGMIWKAEDLNLGRPVALKALRSELAADAEMSQRFRDEARVLAKLSHANIASLYTLIEDDEGLFLVLEYVEGNTLAALLATSGPLPLDSAFALFHQVLDGVGHAHEAGVVHRDLKPANLMVDARGRVKVMDFGIARVSGAARTTHHGKLVGTPEYMSPEQVRGEDATIRSDVYSLGIVLYEMVTGQTPFRAIASFELMRAQIEDTPPDPRTLRPDLDARVAAAILRSLSKRPIDRFATTRELQDALLDAGASRRGRTVAPVWGDVPPASSASEAPTLAHLERGALHAPPQAQSGRATPRKSAAAGSASEPLDEWTQAVDALDEDIDAAYASVGDAAARTEQRAKAHTTLVLDAMQDTARLELVRATRRLGDAPAAANVVSPREESQRSAARRPLAGLLWAIAAAATIALAFGAVRLRTHEAPAVPDAAARPVEPARSERAVPQPPSPKLSAAPISQAEPKPARPSKPRRRREPLRSERTPPTPEAVPSPEPAAESQEETGWVIRR